MNEILKDSEKLCHRICSGAGFEKLGRTWYRNTPESVCVVSLDKSPHGLLLVPYVGVTFRRLSSELRPKINKCSWYGKLVCTEEDQIEFVPILDVDKIVCGRASGVPVQFLGHTLRVLECTSSQHFVGYIERFGLPFLREIETIRLFRTAYEEGRFRHFPIGTARILDVKDSG